MYKKFIVLFLMSCCFELAFTQNKHFNYFCGFENVNDTAGWVFKKRPSVKSSFVIGNAVHRVGAKSMYVSSDGGSSAGYLSTASGYLIVAYRKFTLTAGKYDFSYNYRIAGEALNNNDVLVAAFFSTKKVDGSPCVPQASSSGQVFPNEIELNKVIDEGGNYYYAEDSWSTCKSVLDVKADGDYWLAFYFKESGGLNSNFNPGACIDNVQLVSKYNPGDCLDVVKNVDVQLKQGYCNVSWAGNAPTYELMYHNSTNLEDTTFRIVSGIKANFYSFALMSLDEGCYSFYIRPICGTDTGLWVAKSNVLVYDPINHCLDYLNFHAKGVECTSGTFANPYKIAEVKDFGYASKQSVHTVHYMSDETDRLTGYKLKTVPNGAIASVRLSNWTENTSPSASITYTYTVQPDAKVLLLRYAVVLQYAAHHAANEQTRIHVEILDKNDHLLSPCTEVDFNARDVSEGNTRGWKTYMPRAGEVEHHECPIKWLDWSVIGINLGDYAGQEVKVRLTLYACSANYHFGYAYFVLECSKGDIEGMSCGEVPEHFTVSEGFDYKWYKMSDPTKKTISTERTFIPPVGDTCSYYVDLMYPEDHNCKFTLSAYTLPRMPKAKAGYAWRPRTCENVIKFSNASKVYEYPRDEQPRLTRDSVTSSFWNFGKYGFSEEKMPILVIPNEGDTFDVVLRSEYHSCYDFDTIRVFAPAIKPSIGFDSAYICDGGSVVFNGKRYYTPGDYIDSTLNTVYGCDSILNLHLEVLVTDSIIMYDTICMNEEVDFYGQNLSKSGIYHHHVSSSLGCDSLYYQMNLLVYDTLEVELGQIPTNICADDKEFAISYKVTSGRVTDYSLRFQNEVFSDVPKSTLSDSVIVVDIPSVVRPDNYKAVLTFYNEDCGNIELPIDFRILYPSSIIVQRWNDVLAIRNSENNGGYDFVAFQWFMNGAPIEGMIDSKLYKLGENLNFGSEYSVLLTRADDNVSIPTCSFVPTEFTDNQLNDINVAFPGATVAMNVKSNATAEIWSISGNLVSSQDLMIGSNSLVFPSKEGLYVLRIIESGEIVKVDYIVVKSR